MYTRKNVEIPPKQQIDVTKDIDDFSRFSDKKYLKLAAIISHWLLSFYGVPRDFVGMLPRKHVKLNGVLRFVNLILRSLNNKHKLLH